jgi:hypothetical protein
MAVDTNFAIYQLHLQMWNLQQAEWASGLMTAKFWGVIAFIVIYYLMWWRLTDKSRISDLLLYGAFVAIMREIVNLVGVNSGSFLYAVNVIPGGAGTFIHDLTLSPLTHMLAQQFSPSWKRFLILAAIAAAFIHFLILPIMGYFGVFILMKGGNLIGFATSYGSAILSRAAFHLVKQVQFKAVEGYDSPLKNTLAQPAFKRLPDDDNEKNK